MFRLHDIAARLGVNEQEAARLLRRSGPKPIRHECGEALYDGGAVLVWVKYLHASPNWVAKC